MVAKTIRNVDGNASFSSIAAATKLLEFSDNGLKQPKKELGTTC